MTIGTAPKIGYDASRIPKVKDIIKSHVETYFAGTLGQEQDIVNIINAQIRLESTHNANAIGPKVASTPGTGGFHFLNSSAIKSIFSSGSATAIDNVNKGLYGVGLMQVMGWNFIKGGSPSGSCEIERLRPDLAPQLCVAPGQDLLGHVLGEANMHKAILESIEQYLSKMVRTG